MTIDGGLLELTLTRASCTGAGGGAPVTCAVPPLDAGTYSVKGTTTTLTVPKSAGGDFPTCQ